MQSLSADDDTFILFGFGGLAVVGSSCGGLWWAVVDCVVWAVVIVVGCGGPGLWCAVWWTLSLCGGLWFGLWSWGWYDFVFLKFGC